MANSVMVTSAPTSFFDANPRYTPIGAWVSQTVTEADIETPVRDAGVFSNLLVYASANTALVSSTITLRKSRASTSVVVTYSSLETGFKEDTSNTDSFANTDEADYLVSVANDVSGATALTIQLIGVQFAPTTDTDTVTLFSVFANGSTTSGDATQYFHINGTYSINTTEANSEYRVRSALTVSDLYSYVTSNAHTTDVVIKSRKNSADGNMTVTYTSGQTGSKEDTSNTDSLSVGDDYNYSLTTTAPSAAIRFTIISLSLISTSRVFPMLARRGSNSISFNVTTYSTVSGDMFLTTTEDHRQYYPRFDFTAKELVTYVSSNSIATSATSVTLRDNGADSSVTVSYAAAETGLKNDTTNSATVTSATDEIDVKYVTPNTSGSITFRYAGILGETASASTFTPKVMMM